jgi:hypothetical protein
LLDCLDFVHPPAFLEPPVLETPGYAMSSAHCTPGSPGPIPPTSAERAPAEAARALIRQLFPR